MKLIKILPACGLALGVALVIATSAFTKAPQTKSGDPMYQFTYNPPTTNPYSVSNVENVANWSYDPNATCPSGNVKACTIEASHVDASDPTNPVLLSSEDIDAAATAGVARVISTADAPSLPSSSITNRSN
ncbi:hypothetical protein [Arachidicoccus sp.]|uniref:hypothetical protein n=1 Tax=Arachidicoccus sp. TaxID=1872624 RepID=UPI003D20D2E7